MTTYYKVLKNGRSCSGGKMTWSLPKDGEPGRWHEVDGDLKQCSNGLHLTSEPAYLMGNGTQQCYLAEIEGEAIGPFETELVCRKVRLVQLVPWEELIPEGDGTAILEVRSPAYRLLKHVWASQGEGMGHSWDRLNDAMQTALSLAIRSGMAFDVDDFRRFSSDFNSGYWIGAGGEGYYAMAVGSGVWSGSRSHGPNPSAYQSFEKWRGRKPFIVRMNAGDEKTVRLSVGQRFGWHVKLKSRAEVTVTSFADGPDAHVIACSYKPKERDARGYQIGPDKIDKRFKITHDAIAEYHAAIKDFNKAQAEKAEAEALDRSLQGSAQA